MITLIQPTQGNPIALKRTLDSVKGIVDEIIIGSVCVFADDDEIIKGYGSEYNVRIIKLPFEFIFHSGFSNTLNFLASHATNDLVMYLNVGEIIHKGKEEILSKISDEYNCYFIDHPTETNHRWYRIYNRHELYWQGIIHEEIVPLSCEQRPYFKPLFTFNDTEKDSHDSFKAKVYNDIKELTYFNQYVKLVDCPPLKQITHEWWVKFSKDNYDSMKERLLGKGKRYEAILKGDLDMFLEDIYNNPEFAIERFESNTLVEFQGSKKSL